MRYLKLLLGALAAALLLCFPGAAVDGAQAAMALWYHAVAPSLFPFMALLPLLTCGEVLSLYERALGGLTRRLFDLPGVAAPVLAVAMMAGSPAGSHALRRASGRLDRGQVERLAMACCGMSPGFLVAGVGASMLGSAALGRVLLRSQLASQLLMLFLLKYMLRDGTPVDPAPVAPADRGAMGGAVAGVLAVAGWMALFGAITGALRAVVGAGASAGLACALEITAAARAICAMPVSVAHRLALLSAATGFGGLCVAIQNLSVLSPCGVRPLPWLLARLVAGALSAAITAAQLGALPRAISDIPAPDALKLSCLLLCLALVPAILAWTSRKRTEA